MNKEDVVREIVDAAMTVHSYTPPGLCEKLYEFAMMCELEQRRQDLLFRQGAETMA